LYKGTIQGPQELIFKCAAKRVPILCYIDCWASLSGAGTEGPLELHLGHRADVKGLK